jgi:hypothetical protein
MKLIPPNVSEERMGFDVRGIVGIYVVAGYVHVPRIHGVEKLCRDRTSS